MAHKFHESSRFVEDLCTVSDGGEFSSPEKYIYSKQLELKPECNIQHSTCDIIVFAHNTLGLNICI